MIKIVPSGDSIIIINNLNNLKSSTLTDYLEKLELNEIEDIISLKSSVGIVFNPHKISSSDFIKKTKNLLFNKNFNNNKKIKTWEIPICYDKDFAIDLNEISTKCKIDVNQVILVMEFVFQIHLRIHTNFIFKMVKFNNMENVNMFNQKKIIM